MTKANDGGSDDFELRAGIANFPTGVDEHGEETSVPYLVEPAGNLVGRPTIVSLAKRPTKIEAAALRVLASAIAESGELTPDGDPGCPAGVRSVPVDAFQAAFFADAQKENPTPGPDTCRMRFKRALAALEKARLVGTNGPRIWTVN
jgi:hypothetical protein